MIRTFTLWTDEVDDTGSAVDHVCSQLAGAGALMKNTIGIVACHYEHVYSGIFKAVCEALPFDVVGTISQMQAVPGKADSFLLSILVLTSDDAAFVKVVTPSLAGGPRRATEESLGAACADGKPALIFAFVPFTLKNSGDEYVEAITSVSGGAPCFGTLAVDDSPDFSNCFMLADGEHYQDRMAMILVFGDVRPRFFVANISGSKLISKGAVVTRSKGNVLMELNERPVAEYFDDLGLTGSIIEQFSMSSLPFLLDYGDGTPMVSKLMIRLSPEKHAICGGVIPEGSTLHIGMSDRDDVMSTTGETMDRLLLDIEGASGALMYSCITRGMILGAEQFKEAGLVDQKVGGAIPFIMAGSGGEICPTQVQDGKAINRFHNNAFISCLF
ncbi:MAG: FIST C-terminal domain-containing protein [Clostridiales bacterium]|nr:FIST C-terminal domain-containing protein [Clostridiales bacterium]